MALQRIEDFDPNYKDHFDDHDVKRLDLYAGSEKVGSVDDVLVDEAGHFRYLVINTGIWVFGKKVLLPIGRARIDYNAKRVFADTLTKAQVEALPEFSEGLTADYDYEEQVRGVYRHGTSDAKPASGVGYAGYGSAPPTVNVIPSDNPDSGYAGYEPTLQNSSTADIPAASGVGYAGFDSAPATPGKDPIDLGIGYAGYDRDSYTYQQEPDLYDLDEHRHQNWKLYQERLIASRSRRQA